MQTLAILLRHAFAAIAGMLVHQGIATDAASTGSLVAGLCVYALITILSTLFKMEVSDTHQQIAQKLAAAFASQLVAALAGWLQADAATAADPVALSLFAGNLAVSRLRGHVPPAQVLKVLLLGVMLPALCSCSSFTAADAKYAGEQIGLAAADTAIIIARMQLAQANADLEAAKHEPGANNNAILAKQLGVIAAQQALNAAERAIAKERARLDAKQPRDVQPTNIFPPASQAMNDNKPAFMVQCLRVNEQGGDVPLLEGNQFNPRGSDAGDRPARLEGRWPTPVDCYPPHNRALAVRGRDSSPPITVSTASARPLLPVYAPQVVAMLKAR